MSFRGVDSNKFPNGWEIFPLGELVKIKGRIGWKGYKTEDLRDSGPVVLGGVNIKNSIYLDLSEIKYLSQEKFEESPEIMIHKGDVLLVTRGNGIGDASYFDGTIPEATINPSMVILSNFDGDSKYLFYYLISKDGRNNILSFRSGSSIPALYQKQIAKAMIPVPPKSEQEWIVKFLSTLDDKIEVNNQINKNLENMAQAIFKQWFVDFEFPNEDGEPYKSSGGEMVESELGMIPKGWEVVHLKDKLNFERGIEPGSKNYSKTYFERSIPFYRVGDMLGIAQNYVDKNLINDKTLERRDVAVSFDGTVGRVVTGLRGSYSTGIRKIYAKKGEYFPNCFIYFLFKTEFIQSTIMQYASGTTILHASESIEYLAIPYHEEIIKKFVLIIEAIFNTIVNKKKENESLSNTRDILLPKLMSGKIRVPLDSEGDVS